jgi:hypothetical protein
MESFTRIPIQLELSGQIIACGAYQLHRQLVQTMRSAFLDRKETADKKTARVLFDDDDED